jgi:hypothetical protein
MSVDVTSIEHVLVLSDDIERTRDFDCEVVGLEVGERPALEFPRLLAVRRPGGTAPGVRR